MKGFTGYSSYSDTFRELANQYKDMPIDNVIAAFGRTSASAGFTANPYVQNRRVKAISSLPVEYKYDKVADMITKPNENELPLRQVSHVLESTVAPYWKIRKTYQDLMTYRLYTCPADIETTDEAKTKEFKRELLLTEKIAKAAKIEEKAHEIVGQCVQEGKVFYTMRYEVDKTHNNVNYAFMQQLPQDWIKIVGYNNISKYTVAFNMMYFMEPGTTTDFFGGLFDRYWEDFADVASSIPTKNKNKKFIFAKRSDESYTEKIQRVSKDNPGLNIYLSCGRWYYWVMLTVDKVWCFEVDDVSRNVEPPLTGLFLALVNIAKYEQIQLSLVQNPLVSLVLAEIPYRDDPSATIDDAYRLSPSGRTLFETYWYQMLADTNTTGVGFYSGPFKNMHLEQLSEAPNATEISSNGYKYAIQKSGIGIIPTSDDMRAGMIQICFNIECHFAEIVYRQIENMMNYVYFDLGFKYDWRFHMFGNLYDDEKRIKEAKDGMTLGILSSTLEYLALMGKRISEDISISHMVLGSGVMDMRIPLISTYSAKQSESGLPPQAGGAGDLGGRPRSDEIESEGKEQDFDDGK
jgi:hypothetical protein